MNNTKELEQQARQYILSEIPIWSTIYSNNKTTSIKDVWIDIDKHATSVNYVLKSYIILDNTFIISSSIEIDKNLLSYPNKIYDLLDIIIQTLKKNYLSNK